MANPPSATEDALKSFASAELQTYSDFVKQFSQIQDECSEDAQPLRIDSVSGVSSKKEEQAADWQKDIQYIVEEEEHEENRHTQPALQEWKDAEEQRVAVQGERMEEVDVGAGQDSGFVLDNPQNTMMDNYLPEETEDGGGSGYVMSVPGPGARRRGKGQTPEASDASTAPGRASSPQQQHDVKGFKSTAAESGDAETPMRDRDTGLQHAGRGNGPGGLPGAVETLSTQTHTETPHGVSILPADPHPQLAAAGGSRSEGAVSKSAPAPAPAPDVAGVSTSTNTDTDLAGSMDVGMGAAIDRAESHSESVVPPDLDSKRAQSGQPSSPPASQRVKSQTLVEELKLDPSFDYDNVALTPKYSAEEYAEMQHPSAKGV